MSDPKIKSYSEILSEMVDSFSAKTDLQDLQPGSAIKGLMEALEAGMTPRDRFFRLLRQLGLKSPPDILGWGGPLQVEDLDITLKSVTFDEEKLKLWKGSINVSKKSP